MGDNVHPPEDKSIEALEKRERAMSTLIQNLPGMAYRCRNDEAWTMDYFSEGCLEVTGRPPDEFVGNRLLSYGDIIVPEDVDYVWREVQAALDEQRAYTLEYRITDPAGDIRWVWERGRQVDTEPDGTAVLEGFITEVTARKEAEAELHELNATLERKIAARTEELEVANEQLLEHDRLK